MRIAVDISLYPLDPNYVPPIKSFIERLNQYSNLNVQTNALSTQISGEHAHVFEALSKEIGTTFEEQGKRVFVLKVLGGS